MPEPSFLSTAFPKVRPSTRQRQTRTSSILSSILFTTFTTPASIQLHAEGGAGFLAELSQKLAQVGDYLLEGFRAVPRSGCPPAYPRP